MKAHTSLLGVGGWGVTSVASKNQYSQVLAEVNCFRVVPVVVPMVLFGWLFITDKKIKYS